MIADPEGRRTRYELADDRIGHALDDLIGLVLTVDPACCPAAEDRRLLLMSAPTRPRRDVLARRIRLLVAATITYNVVEAIVAMTEGTRVSSTALIGFGLDSVIEVSSAAAVAWQFSAQGPRERGRRPRCGSSRSRSSLSPPTSPSTPCGH